MGDIDHETDVPEGDDSTQEVALDQPVTESMGPIQMTSLAFPGNRFKGEILPELEKLKKAGIVRIVDLLLVRKDELGNVMVTTASDLDWEEAVSFGSYVGALAGYRASDRPGSRKARSPARPSSPTATSSTRTTSSASPRRCRRT